MAIALCALAVGCKTSQPSVEGMSEEQFKVSSLVIEAATQREVGNLSKAQELYESILKLQPDNSVACYHLASLHFEQQNIASAVEYNERAIKLAPKNHWYREQIAEIFVRTSRLEDAAKQYEVLLKQNPACEQYYTELAYIYLQGEKYDKAIETLDRMEKRFGVSEGTAMFKYRLFKELNRQDKAAKEMERLSKAFPQNTEYLSVLAQNAVQSGEDDKAYTYFKKIEELAPEDENNTIALVEYFVRSNRGEEAEQYLDKLCSNKNVDFKTKNMVLLSIYSDKVDSDQETFLRYMGHLKSMTELHEEQAELWEFLSIAYMRILAYPDAIYAIRKAVSLGSNDYQLYQNLLFAQSTCDSSAAIIETATQAIELYPSQPIPYLFKGVNELAIGQSKAAIETLKRGLQRAGKDKALSEDFNLNLADAYHSEGENEKAFEHYEKVLELNPNNFPALNNYAYYLALENRDIEKAEKMAERLYAEYKDNLTYADTYAWVLYVAGKYDKALEVMNKFLDSESTWSETIKQHYEQIKQKAGQ